MKAQTTLYAHSDELYEGRNKYLRLFGRTP